MPAITLINYPFGLASSNPRSGDVPHMLEEACAPHFKNRITEWREANVPHRAANSMTNGVKNRNEVRRAVTALALETANAQWADQRTLTIGGDHSQGLATIKATLLVSVVKAFIDSHIPTRCSFEESDRIRKQVRLHAKEGEWEDIGKIFDRMVDTNALLQSDIDAVTDNYAVLWIDAHGDFNTEDTSNSGNFHGMVLAAACGLRAGGIEKLFGACIRMNRTNVHVIAARDLDEHEEAIMQNSGVNFIPYAMDNEQNPGIRSLRDENGRTLKEVVDFIFEQNRKFIVSVDIDHLDASCAPATGTVLVRDETGNRTRVNRFGETPPGISLDHSRRALYKIMYHPKVVAADLTEPGYAIETDGLPCSDDLQTLKTTVTLLASMLGYGSIGIRILWHRISGGLARQVGTLLKAS